MNTKEDRIAALRQAIMRGGGIMKFSREVGVKHQAVYAWMRRGYVPPDKAHAIETLYGVPRGAMLSPKMAALLIPPPTAADII